MEATRDVTYGPRRVTMDLEAVFPNVSDDGVQDEEEDIIDDPSSHLYVVTLPLIDSQESREEEVVRLISTHVASLGIPDDDSWTFVASDFASRAVQEALRRQTDVHLGITIEVGDLRDTDATLAPSSLPEGLGGGGFGGIPASASHIEKLRKITYGGGSLGQIEETECVICAEELEAGAELKLMPCSHGFHGHCLDRWLKLSGICPLCRYKLPDQPDEDDDQRH